MAHASRALVSALLLLSSQPLFAQQVPAEQKPPVDTSPTIVFENLILPGTQFPVQLVQLPTAPTQESPQLATLGPCDKTTGWDACELIDYKTSVTLFSASLENAVRVLVSRYTEPLATSTNWLVKKGYPYLEQGLDTLVQRSLGAGLSQQQTKTVGVVGKQVEAKIRAAMKREEGACKGAVVYLQGFGDSLQNHMKLFSALSSQGYRVMTFDYMGQGGSTGELNDTRIENIPDLAEQVYAKYMSGLPACANKKIVIGSSTGGTAATFWATDQYWDGKTFTVKGKSVTFPKKASNQGITAMVLINPVIAMKAPHSGGDLRAMATSGPINRKMLTGLEEDAAKAAGWIDEIVIRAKDGSQQIYSPLSTPDLMASTILNANISSFYVKKESLPGAASVKSVMPTWAWDMISPTFSVGSIKSSLKGFVLLADDQYDVFASPKLTEDALKASSRAGQLKFENYPGSSHMIEGSASTIADKAIADIIAYLGSI